jgi:hypothetical protein
MEKEKMKRILLITAGLAMLLNACSKATPTADPVQIQASAIAIANTIIAMTQAAVPTATETPIPSPTPLPSPTLELPTLELLPSPTATLQSGERNCTLPLDMGVAGPKHTTVVVSRASGTFNLSLNLWQPNAFGECGVLGLSHVGKGDRVSLGLPSGDWFAYAWITLKNGGSSTSSGSFYVKPAEFDKFELCVGDDVIAYKPSC